MYERWRLFAHFHRLEEGDAGVDVLVHHLVDVHEVDNLAEVSKELLDEGAALQAFLMAKVEGLGSVEKLDSQHALHVLHDAVAFCCGVATHAHQVFLVLA